MRRDPLEQKVLTYVTQQKMVEPGERVLLAVSGGADSTALLMIFYALAAKLGIELAVAHLDHGLRPDSWQEAELVEAHCRFLNLPLYTRTTDVRAYCREHGMGVEAGAREVRYRWLTEAAERFGAQHIATAHHRDDQAETILLHLLRGSGLKGLAGMEPAGKRYIRPLLACDKAELVDYLARRDVAYREDESNEDTVYLRNRVRHQLLPLLEAEYNPLIRDALFRLGELARQDYGFLEGAAQEAMTRMVREVASGSWRIDLKAWRQEHPALQAQVVMRALAAVRGQDDFTSRDVEMVMRLAGSQGSAKRVDLSGDVRAAREYDMLYLGTRKMPDRSEPYHYHLNIPGQVTIAERGLVITASQRQPSGSQTTVQTLALHAEACPSQLAVRSRQRGDRISLPGGTKRLSDWYIDHKVPYRERDTRLLLAAGRQVIWIEGGPLAMPFRPQPDGARIWITVSQEG